jgi:hypothetical protein
MGLSSPAPVGTLPPGTDAHMILCTFCSSLHALALVDAHAEGTHAAVRVVVDMLAHVTAPPVIREAMSALSAFTASSPEHCETLISAGGVSSILTALAAQDRGSTERVLAAAVLAHASAASVKACTELVANESLLPVLLALVDEGPDSAGAFHAALVIRSIVPHSDTLPTRRARPRLERRLIAQRARMFRASSPAICLHPPCPSPHSDTRAPSSTCPLPPQSWRWMLSLQSSSSSTRRIQR